MPLPQSIAGRHRMFVIYHFEQKIETLAENAVGKSPTPGSFEASGVYLSHWDFSYRENAWLATSEIAAGSFQEAYDVFMSRLTMLVPRIAFVSQCYTDFLAQPFLVTRKDLNLSFFRYSKPTGGVGLMFMEDDEEALGLLLENKVIPNEFFYYWNDAVNAIGYSAKLLIMLSALEAFAKKTGGRGKDFSKLEEILGAELKEKLFGTKEKSDAALRHRLVHGEYFNSDDFNTNVVELVHKKVMDYFNKKILEKELLGLEIVRPQRHLFGNREECRLYIRPIAAAPLSLKAVLADIQEHGIDNMNSFEAVYDDDVHKNF